MANLWSGEEVRRENHLSSFKRMAWVLLTSDGEQWTRYTVHPLRSFWKTELQNPDLPESCCSGISSLAEC